MGDCRSCGGRNSGDAEYCIHCGEHLGVFRICVECGIVNRPDASSCRMCGAKLGERGRAQKPIPRERPGYRPNSLRCPKCGLSYDMNLVECPRCERKVPEDRDPTVRSSGIPTAAGTLLFVAGFLCVLNGVFIGSLGDTVVEFAYCGFVEILLGIVVMTGWIFCMQRTHLVFVMVVSVVTMFSVGPFFLSSLLGLIALVLVAVSAKEFR